jgi:hypothetical protein
LIEQKVMPKPLLFSEEEEDLLRSHSAQWKDAAAGIGRQNVADAASTSIAAKREESLATKLSPRERQQLFEVCLCLTFSSQQCSTLLGNPCLVPKETSPVEKGKGT